MIARVAQYTVASCISLAVASSRAESSIAVRHAPTTPKTSHWLPRRSLILAKVWREGAALSARYQRGERPLGLGDTSPSKNCRTPLKRSSLGGARESSAGSRCVADRLFFLTFAPRASAWSRVEARSSRLGSMMPSWPSSCAMSLTCSAAARGVRGGGVRGGVGTFDRGVRGLLLQRSAGTTAAPRLDVSPSGEVCGGRAEAWLEVGRRLGCATALRWRSSRRPASLRLTSALAWPPSPTRELPGSCSSVHGPPLSPARCLEGARLDDRKPAPSEESPSHALNWPNRRGGLSEGGGCAVVLVRSRLPA
mmetsp:Transcript_31461/g.73247  ORF Transcript_31461/g.73247 Transcript_31461/m.73247 type:complete len:308 (+) Transcript_31461:90-1013(+)